MRDDHVVAAGVLHDVIEDADVRSGELLQRFGEEVTRLVVSVSDPTAQGSYAERKARRLGHHPLVRQLRFELEALALLPPGRDVARRDAHALS